MWDAACVGRLDEAQQALSELAVEPAELPQGAHARLARLRVETGLRMPDCCVLHAAETRGAERIATFDGRLARAAATVGFRTP